MEEDIISQLEYTTSDEDISSVDENLIEDVDEKIINYEGLYSEGVYLSVYSCPIRYKLPFIKQWAYNRLLNKEHVDNIQKSLENKPYVIGTIKLMKNRQDNQYEILDGQHRIEAIRNLCNRNPEYNIKCQIEEYLLDDKEGEQGLKLYNICNNNLNVYSINFPTVKFTEVINSLARKYSLGIIDKNEGCVRRPKITKKEFQTILRTKMTDEWLSLYSVSDIVKKVDDMNNDIFSKSNNWKLFFGREDPKESKKKILEKAAIYGFFLNLDCKLNINVWINKL